MDGAAATAAEAAARSFPSTKNRKVSAEKLVAFHPANHFSRLLAVTYVFLLHSQNYSHDSISVVTRYLNWRKGSNNSEKLTVSIVVETQRGRNT
jgi:hypothetical protein